MLLPATLPFPVMALVQSSVSHKLVSDFIIYLFSRCQSFEIKALPVIHVAANLNVARRKGVGQVLLTLKLMFLAVK